MPTTTTVPKRYRLPQAMADALGNLKEEEDINESAFVRRAIASELAKRGIIVDYRVDRGGWRERKPKQIED